MIVLKSDIVLFWCLFIIAFKGIELDSVVRFDIIVRLLFLMIVVILYFNGYTNTNIHYRDGSIRHSMGLSNPNVFSIHVMMIVSEYLYLKRKKLGLSSAIIVLHICGEKIDSMLLFR